MKVYFVRHGQTDFNLKPTALGREKDNGLNGTGLKQAGEARDNLKGKNFDIIFSSPLKRAKQTAEIINEFHNKQINFDNRLEERIIRSDKVINRDEWMQMLNFDNELVNDSERLGDFFIRIYSFLDDISAKYQDETVLVVSHGGVRHAFHAYFNNLPWKGNMCINRTDNAEVVEFERYLPIKSLDEE